MVQERGIAEILKDTASNIQDIIRSEILLAKIEVKQEAVKVKAAGAMFGVGAIFGFFGIGFCLLCIVWAIALVLPAWAAALIVGVLSLILGAVLFSAGLTRWRTVKLPEKSMFTVKEDLAWMRNQSRS